MNSATSLMVTASALVGLALASSKALATLPLSLMFLSMMLTSIPASMLMSRWGRKPGFIFSSLIGMLAAAIATWAIMVQSFWLFCTASAGVGIFNGFGNYYRFAAVDSAAEAHKSKAISWVLAGGVAAAFIGPNLANYSQNLIEHARFAGSFAALFILYLLAFIVLQYIEPPPEKSVATTGQSRPLKVIIHERRLIIAILCGMLGYGVMSLIMTATPLAMKHHHHIFRDTAFVIQWHIVAMFAPSFITGSLIERFTAEKVMITGVIAGFACVVINLLGSSLWHFWIALVCLGISWNFLFIGSTALLTETYRPEEKFKVQALNDFMIFTTVTLASLSAGALQHLLGWRAVNLGVTPLLAIMLVGLLSLQQHKKTKHK